MLSLLNHYQLLRDEIILLIFQEKISEVVLEPVLLKENKLLREWGILFEGDFIERKKGVVGSVVMSGVNHPTNKKKSDLESLISEMINVVKPFRSL